MKKLLTLLGMAAMMSLGAQAAITSYTVVDTTSTEGLRYFANPYGTYPGEYKCALGMIPTIPEVWKQSADPVNFPRNKYVDHPEFVGKKIVGIKVFNQLNDARVGNYYAFITTQNTEGGAPSARPQPLLNSVIMNKTPFTVENGTGVAWFADPVTITENSYFYVGYSLTVTDENKNYIAPVPWLPARADLNGHALADWYQLPGFYSGVKQDGFDIDDKAEVGHCMIVYLADDEEQQGGGGDDPQPPVGPGSVSDIDYNNLSESCWLAQNNTLVRYVGQDEPQTGIHMMARAVWTNQIYGKYNYSPELKDKYVVGMKVFDQLTPVTKKRFPGHDEYFIFAIISDEANGFQNSPSRNVEFIQKADLEIGEDGTGFAYFDEPILCEDNKNIFMGYGFNVTEINSETDAGMEGVDNPVAKKAGLEFPVRKGAWCQADAWAWIPRCADNNGGWYGWYTQRYFGNDANGNKNWAGAPVSLLYWDPAVTGIESNTLQTQIVDVKYYDLTGKQVINPQHGLVIRVETLSNGKQRTSKKVL